ncbi:MAG: formylglycine-generating enzyme family protein [Pseudomonadota bacterium]
MHVGSWKIVRFFLKGAMIAVILILGTAENRAGGSIEVGITGYPTDLPKVSVGSAEKAVKAVKSQFVREMYADNAVQRKHGTGSPGSVHYTNPRDGYEMVLIPKGEVIFGTGPDDPYFRVGETDIEKPQFKADIPECYIGMYCVTNEQYLKFVNETGHRPPEQAEWGKPVWKDGKFPENKAKHPVVCVSWHDAKAYCEWSGLGLPSELQWEKAARGFDGRIYPWGNEWDEKKLRNYNNKGLGTTCAVDDYPEGTSIFGIYNMSGNVWEWCEDWYENNVYERYARKDLTLPSAGQSKILRGGSWHGDAPLPFRCGARLPKNPEDRAHWVGFRCVRGPAPSDRLSGRRYR